MFQENASLQLAQINSASHAVETIESNFFHQTFQFGWFSDSLDYQYDRDAAQKFKTLNDWFESRPKDLDSYSSSLVEGLSDSVRAELERALGSMSPRQNMGSIAFGYLYGRYGIECNQIPTTLEAIVNQDGFCEDGLRQRLLHSDIRNTGEISKVIQMTSVLAYETETLGRVTEDRLRQAMDFIEFYIDEFTFNRVEPTTVNLCFSKLMGKLKTDRLVREDVESYLVGKEKYQQLKIPQIWAVFEALDVNKDGEVTGDEMWILDPSIPALFDFTPEASPSSYVDNYKTGMSVLSEQDLDFVIRVLNSFYEIDTDGDGVITPEELVLFEMRLDH